MKVFVAGAYGYGNFGDDCYVDVLRTQLSGIWSELHLDILSQFDEAEFRPHTYDAMLLAGGGLLYNWTSECGSNSLKHYLRYPAIAQWLGKKSFLLGLGTQGRLDPAALEPFLGVLNGADVRSVRDSQSARLLRAAGVCSPVHECADLVYTKQVFPLAGLFDDGNSSGKPVLGVVASQPGRKFAHPEFAEFEDRFRQALEALEADFALHFISFDNRSDPWLARSWQRDHGYSSFEPARPSAIEEFIRALAGIDVLVTTRYHGAVLSTMMGIPFLGIGAPGQKTHRECEDLCYPQFVPYSANAGEYVNAVRQTWSEREYLHAHLLQRLPQKRRLAQRNFELLKSVHVEPEYQAGPMIPTVAAAACGPSAGRTLVVWAAGPELWPEASYLFNALKSFDCIIPPKFALTHRNMDGRIVLPEPGVMIWKGFPSELRERIAGRYGNVVLCHAGSTAKATDLIEIGARSGRCVWDFRLWRYTIRPAAESELASARFERQTQGAAV